MFYRGSIFLLLYKYILVDKKKNEQNNIFEQQSNIENT